MGIRFRKSINLGKHFRINLSSKGIGYSYGVKGYRHTVSADGKEKITTSIPGTGISNTKYISKKIPDKQNSETVYWNDETNESTEEQYMRVKANASLYAILSVIFIISGIASYLFLLPTIYILVFGITGIIFALNSIQKRKKCKILELQIENEFKQLIKLDVASENETADETYDKIEDEKADLDNVSEPIQEQTDLTDKQVDRYSVNEKIFDDVMRRTRERIAKQQKEKNNENS